MFSANQSDVDAIMDEVERTARETVSAPGALGVSSRAMLTAGRPLMQAVVGEIERRTPPMEAALGLAPLFASAISSVFVNTDLAGGGPQLEYALDVLARRIIEQTLAHMATARSGTGKKDLVGIQAAGRA